MAINLPSSMQARSGGQSSQSGDRSIMTFGIVVALVVILAGAGWYFFTSKSSSDSAAVTNETALPTDTGSDVSTPSDPGTEKTNEAVSDILRTIELCRTFCTLDTKFFEDSRFRSLVDTTITIDPVTTPPKERKLELITAKPQEETAETKKSGSSTKK